MSKLQIAVFIAIWVALIAYTAFAIWFVVQP